MEEDNKNPKSWNAEKEFNGWEFEFIKNHHVPTEEPNTPNSDRIDKELAMELPTPQQDQTVEQKAAEVFNKDTPKPVTVTEKAIDSFNEKRIAEGSDARAELDGKEVKISGSIINLDLGQSLTVEEGVDVIAENFFAPSEDTPDQLNIGPISETMKRNIFVGIDPGAPEGDQSLGYKNLDEKHTVVGSAGTSEENKHSQIAKAKSGMEIILDLKGNDGENQLPDESEYHDDSAALAGVTEDSIQILEDTFDLDRGDVLVDSVDMHKGIPFKMECGHTVDWKKVIKTTDRQAFVVFCLECKKSYAILSPTISQQKYDFKTIIDETENERTKRKQLEVDKRDITLKLTSATEKVDYLESNNNRLLSNAKEDSKLAEDADSFHSDHVASIHEEHRSNLNQLKRHHWGDVRTLVLIILILSFMVVVIACR